MLQVLIEGDLQLAGYLPIEILLLPYALITEYPPIQRTDLPLLHCYPLVEQHIALSGPFTLDGHPLVHLDLPLGPRHNRLLQLLIEDLVINLDVELAHHLI